MQLEVAEKSTPTIVNGNFLNMVARIRRLFLFGWEIDNGNDDDETTIPTIKKINSKLATTTTTTTAAG